MLELASTITRNCAALLMSQTAAVVAEKQPLGAGTTYTASPALNYHHLHGGPASKTFKDDMADDVWALGVTFCDLVSCSLRNANTAFAYSLSTLQAIKADRPDDSEEVQARAAVFHEQVKWVST